MKTIRITLLFAACLIANAALAANTAKEEANKKLVAEFY